MIRQLPRAMGMHFVGALRTKNTILSKNSLRGGWLAIAMLFCLIIQGKSQHYNSSHVFAHNDYARAVPFYTAYNLQVGYIEADVFLHHGQLAVAHHQHEIEPGKTLDSLYLMPLIKQVRKNGGSIYADSNARLTLMIDLKTEDVSTLNKVVELLDKFPDLISARSLQFMISGNVPDPALWDQYPSFIYFDGRPGIPYTPAQLKRVSMISTSFGQHVKWGGRDKLSTETIKKIKRLMKAAHDQGKKFRFWGTPDFENAWRQFMDLKMDVVVTDHVSELAAYLKDRR